MPFSKMIGVLVGAIMLQLQVINCQDSTTLPDSIPTTVEGNCAEQFLLDNTICCDMIEQAPTRFFCRIQCSISGICLCVDRASGEAIDGIPSFPETDRDLYDCLDVLPTTAAPLATTEAETVTSAATTSETTTDVPLTTNASTTSESPRTDETPMTTEPAPTEESEAIATDEEPTDNNMCDESSSTKDSSSSRRNSHSSRRNSHSSKSDCYSSSSSSRSSKSTSSSSTGNSGSSSSSNSRSKRCTTVKRLLHERCLPSCLRLNRRKCPVCDVSCNASSTRPNSFRGCNCRDSQQVCTRRGLFGFYQCVDRPGIGETCEIDEEDKTPRWKLSAIYRRFQLQRSRIVGRKEKLVYGRLGKAKVECQNGTVCVEGDTGTKTCQQESTNSACVEAQMADPSISCTPSGEFVRLQCREEIGLTFCQCVRPDNGAAIPRTEVIVEEIEDLPDCEALDHAKFREGFNPHTSKGLSYGNNKMIIQFGNAHMVTWSHAFRNCTIEVRGVVTGVVHGDSLVDPMNCSRCTCDNGSLVDCQSSQKCNRITINPKTCSYRNRIVQHGERFNIKCASCGCYNGRIRCSRKQCRPLRDQCAQCRRRGYSPVCSSNGVTYLTRCHAVFCEGQIPFKLFPGSCKDNDVCSRFPCGANETCIKKAGATCIADCKAEDLRVCVNVGELTCSSMEENETKVCATNGITYYSLCRLLQDSKRESVAYAGECDSKDCSTGKVCGSDGVTYDNICALRSTAADARLDYLGKCLNEEGVSTEDTCNQVMEEQLCKFNSDNCKALVQPADGCCPICGGIVIIAIDISGMREYIKINPVASTFDSVYERLVDSDVFSRDTTKRCEVEFTIINRNIQLMLSAKTPGDEEFCQDESVRIAEVFNNPQAHVIFLPDVMQFASAVVALTPEVTQSDPDSTTASATSIQSILAVTLLITIINTLLI